MNSNTQDIFSVLRKTSKEKCNCGNADFIAPMFHADKCLYKDIAEKSLNYEEDEH